MKKLFLSIAIVATTFVAFSQQDEQFSQNMHNRLSINPGYAGTNGSICAVILGRHQWVGFPGAPEHYLFSLDAPVFKQTPLHGGAGLTIRKDGLGNDNSLFAKACYAYHLTLGSVGVLGIGLEAGIQQKAIDANWVSTDPYTLDNAIPDVKTSSLTYDLGFGLYYTTPQLYVGLSSSHLPEMTLKDAGSPTNALDKLDFLVARHYYLMAGYDFPLGDITLKPSVFVKSDAASTIFDINCNVMYKDMVWLGASYRLQDAIVPMVGFNWKPNDKSNLKIGYSYDVTTSQLKSYSNGTHEIMLGYCIKIIPKVKTQSHINPRFLK
jgi:type IX secretion system PorP/SprF family membrane protein